MASSSYTAAHQLQKLPLPKVRPSWRGPNKVMTLSSGQASAVRTTRCGLKITKGIFRAYFSGLHKRFVRELGTRSLSESQAAGTWHGEAGCASPTGPPTLGNPLPTAFQKGITMEAYNPQIPIPE